TSIVALRWLTQKRQADSATLVLALIGSASLDKLIKVSVKRPRPHFMLHRSKSSGSSFPSNHSFTSLATYGAIALLITRRRTRNIKPANRRKVARRVWAPVLL